MVPVFNFWLFKLNYIIRAINLSDKTWGINKMKNLKPIVGITMGDPVGIGPEIILKALCDRSLYKECRPIVLGDIKILESAKKIVKSSLEIEIVDSPDAGRYTWGYIDVINLSGLEPDQIIFGKPDPETGAAMAGYIETAIDMAISGKIDAIATSPINKQAMHMGGSKFGGHTELLAARTKTTDYAMMLTGDRLSVVLVTIHVPLKDVASLISKEKIIKIIKITEKGLRKRFGLKKPKIGVAGLNPHAGEGGMFGNEEETIIAPAVNDAKKEGIEVSGPFPPDTIFYKAVKGEYDAVVCMYHDQGLIPFKMIHFADGVNTTLGLPIIRTSVDHGTAYDIAGTGNADTGSLVAAIKLAANQALISR